VAIPRSKNELLTAIRLTYQKLRIDLIEIDPSEAFLKELPGHSKNTKMSVTNLVAYLIGWGELVLKWNSTFENGSKPIFPEEGFKWTELGALAQKFYSDYEQLSFEELIEKLDLVVNSLLILIEASSNEDLYQKNWYKKYSMGRMIQLNTSSPYKNARSRVRKWKRSNSQK